MALDKQLTHRGPDGAGAWSCSDCQTLLVHTRLAIIDPRAIGDQPLWDMSGRFVIVCNGEIYNYRELRSELRARGIRFETETDTEVVVAGVALDGPDFISRLNGIFAFVIHDTLTHQTFVARDALGVKPLYVGRHEEGITIGSEMSTVLVDHRVRREVDNGALRDYVLYQYSPGERTPLQDVQRLAPGRFLVVERDGSDVQEHVHFELPVGVTEPVHTDAVKTAVELRREIGAAVRRQMVADVPVGALLSGGVDSTALCAIALAGGDSIACAYTMVQEGDFAEGSVYESDLEYARMAAHELGIRLVEVDGRLDLAQRFEEYVAALDEPLADPAAFNTYLITERARQDGVKVLLSGAGGDDLFSGYRRHSILRMEERMGFVPPVVRRGIASVLLSAPIGAGRRRGLERVLRGVGQERDERIGSMFEWPDRSLVDELFVQPRDPSHENCIASSLEAATSADPVERCLRAEMQRYLPDHNLNYTDKMGMANALEIRVPLVDVELVKFASSIDPALKQRGRTGKWILREAVRHDVPDAILERSKMGFGAPVEQWLREDLKAIADDHLSPESIAEMGVFDPGAVARLRAEGNGSGGHNMYTVFSVLMIQAWMRLHSIKG